ncbi:unnamed protein product [Cylicocyclus nassatus]|uniref:Uncharacterized protein n=1 Tax=Cylicocyclus nassatus TaxID=53992 RepID=A0AA36GSE8_CYLNA|nr:unnamed protein product [Cylicocyclus nassatus]
MWPIAFLLLLLCCNADAIRVGIGRFRNIGKIRKIHTRSPGGRTQSPNRGRTRDSHQDWLGVLDAMLSKYQSYQCGKQCWNDNGIIEDKLECAVRRCL